MPITSSTPSFPEIFSCRKTLTASQELLNQVVARYAAIGNVGINAALSGQAGALLSDANDGQGTINIDERQDSLALEIARLVKDLPLLKMIKTNIDQAVVDARSFIKGVEENTVAEPQKELLRRLHSQLAA